MTIENKEQTDQSSTEQTEGSSKISSMKDAAGKYEEQTEKSSEEKPEAKKEKPSETPEEAGLWLVDKDGKKTPVAFKADGKDHRPTEAAKALQYMSLGVHSNVKTEDANRRLADIEKAEPFLKMIQEAWNEGRLVVDGKKIGEEKNEEEDIFEDEEAKKSKEKMASLEKDIAEMKKLTAKKTIESYKTEMDKQMDAVRGDNFAAMLRTDEESPREVWELLAEVDPTTQRSKYTPEEAMKKSHESIVNFIKKVTENHPELLKDFSEEAVSTYLRDKENREKAPVGPPSSVPAGVKPKPEDKIKNMADAMQKADAFFKEKHKTEQKS
jgi:hypothetical protein